MESNQTNFVSNFDLLPDEYNQMWLKFTNKSSMSVQEVENEINQMLTSLTIQEKWFEFNLIVLRLKPDQRVLEGLLMICQMANNFIYQRSEVIEKGGLLLQTFEHRFTVTMVNRVNAIDRVDNTFEKWLMVLDQVVRLLPMNNNLVPCALPQTSYKGIEALKTMLQFTIDIMNKFILLVQKVARSLRLPVAYQRAEWIAAELNRASLYSPQLCTTQPRSIKMILNATVAKCLYVKLHCERLFAQYHEIMNDIFYNVVVPTQQTTQISSI